MPKAPPPEDPNARLVDDLLKDLPHAREEDEPAATPAPSSPARRAAVTQGPQVGKARGADRPPALGVWLRVGLALGLAGAITQWPYPRACGWPLLGYGAGVLAVTTAAGWASIFTWRAHLAVGHVISLGTLIFALGLAASVVLPRVGYAATPATWPCVATAPVPVTGQTPNPAVPDPAIPVPPLTADSTLDSTTSEADSTGATTDTTVTAPDTGQARSDR